MNIRVPDMLKSQTNNKDLNKAKGKSLIIDRLSKPIDDKYSIFDNRLREANNKMSEPNSMLELMFQRTKPLNFDRMTTAEAAAKKLKTGPQIQIDDLETGKQT